MFWRPLLTVFPAGPGQKRALALAHPKAATHPHERLVRPHQRLGLPLVDRPRHAAGGELRRACELPKSNAGVGVVFSADQEFDLTAWMVSSQAPRVSRMPSFVSVAGAIGRALGCPSLTALPSQPFLHSLT